MRKLACSWLLLLAFFLPAATQDLATAAQQSHFQYIYQITNEEALDFLKKGRISPGDVSLFHTKVDSVPFNEPLLEPTKAGHYLLVRIIENEVRVELKSVNNTNIQLVNNWKDLSFIITDLQGNSLNHLIVKAGNWVVNFDATTDTYRERKSNTDGWLTYDYQGHLHIYDLKKSHNQGFFKKVGDFISSKTPVAIISDVVDLAGLAIDIPRDLLKFINYSHPSDAWFELRNKYAFFFGYNNAWDAEHYTGYMVLNKPRYRPGETVYYKAYILDKYNKPVRGYANLVVWLSGKGKTILQQIESYAPGAFEGSFVLHDSLELKLDFNHHIFLERPNGNSFLSQFFYFADYELGNIQLSVEKPQSYHFRGQNLELQISGKDENDLPLYDARLEIAVYPREVNKFFAHQTFVPDTLLKASIPLESGTPTPFIIPDSLFPEINLHYEALITLISHDNQKRENKQRLQFFFKKEEFEYRLQDSLITFHFRENGISKQVPAQLLWQNQNGQTGLQKEVILPHTERINGGIYQYKLMAHGMEEVLRPSEHEDGVGILEERSHEEVLFRVNNPRNLNFTWFLYKNDQEAARGEDDSFFMKEMATTSDNYFLSIHYLWAGKEKAQKRASVFQPGQLVFGVTQPERVFPGQTTTIELSVKDAWGQPAANTDLTAFAWTKKFNAMPSNIQGSYVRNHRISTYNNFRLANLSNKASLFTARHKEFWFQEAGLDTMPYFQFRFPGKDLFTTTTETFTGETQFAPFVVKNGLQLPIHVVYINGKPVYTSLAGHARPFSFKVEPGYNHIRLRTSRNEIIIDSLFLETGKKTFVSLDLDLTMGFAKRRAPLKLTRKEKKTLFPILIPINLADQNPLFWTDENGEVTLLNRLAGSTGFRNSWNVTLVGPMNSGNRLIQNTAGPAFNTLISDQHINYLSENGLLEARPIDNNLLRARWLGGPIGDLKDEILTKTLFDENLRRIQEAYNRPVFDYKFPNRTEYGRGRLHIEMEIDKSFTDTYGSPAHIILWNAGNNQLALYPGNQQFFHNLDEGNYHLVFVFRENTFLKEGPFSVKPYGQIHYKLKLENPPVNDPLLHSLFEPLAKRIQRIPERQHLGGFAPMLYRKPYAVSMRGETVSGRVFDQTDGFPLPGVTVMVKGTNIGTVTNLDGFYSINVPPGLKLTFSFIGMAPYELNPSKDKHDVYLMPDIVSLQEVIAVGYGSQARISLSGATSGIRIRGASGIYGSRAADSDIIFAVVESEMLPPPPDQIDITSPLEAFVMPDFTGWEPGAQSGSIRSNFSDYAYWQPRLRTDAKGKASFEVTFPDDVTFWNTFVYAMNEKRQSGRHIGGIQSFQALIAQLSIPRFLVEGDTAFALGRITSYLQDTLNISTYFELAGQQVKSVNHLVTQTAIDTLLMTSAMRDSLQVKYHLEYNGFVDGEERKIPVMPKGLEKTLGQFWSLKTDSTFSVSFDQSLGEVSLYAKSNPLELFLDDIERLIRFPYNCNEQEASRLIALLAKKEIYTLTGKRFWQEGRIRSTINDLVKNQNSEGLWGWWGNSPHSSIWMSEHVLKALQMATEKGYEVNYSRPITSGMLAFYGEKNLPQRERASLIRIMLMHGYEAEYDKMIRQLAARDTRRELFYELAELNQLAGIEQNARAVLDSAKYTFFGNMYFSGKGNPMSFWGTNTTNTLAAYRIFDRAGESYQQYLEPIFSYLLEVRDVSFPSSTYFSSNLIYSIMPTLVEMAAAGERAARLELSGAVDSLAMEFPLELRFSPEKALQVTKTGASPVYLTTYQRYWEGQPTAEGGDIKVHSWFEGVSEANKLDAAKEVTLKVTVTLEKPAEYLMLEVPIPAGCSYADNQTRGTSETHREQWRHQTTLFFNKLGPGTYTYEIKLLPRFSGTYTLNPAKAELMYFPLFNANNEMRKVVIE